jgi:hypothetical protein
MAAPPLVQGQQAKFRSPNLMEQSCKKSFTGDFPNTAATKFFLKGGNPNDRF